MSSISSIPASAPVQAPAVSAPTPPDATASSGTDDARAAASQPAVLAALPPGQGARIAQIA
jgi:hypothetical protein